MHYRKIWEDAYGPIPTDSEGRTFEIHHIDGDRNNNDLSNLMCVSSEEHYAIHFAQGDWFACALIKQRMNQSDEERRLLSEKISQSNSLRIGPANHFYGKTHSEATKERLRILNTGANSVHYGTNRPEHSQHMKSLGFGKNKTKEHQDNLTKALRKRAATDPVRASLWEVTHNGERLRVKNLKKFCRDNNLKYLTVYSTAKKVS